MFKNIDFQLKDYNPTPPSLVCCTEEGNKNASVKVDLARLFHHYYLDTRGYAPPDPDLARFEHLSLFTTDKEFRVRGDGFGTGLAFRRSTSNQLGQAFCRWFLYEHLNITYFAHMDAVLNRPAHPNSIGHEVFRVSPGDAPDYLCAQDRSSVFLAEAKGRSKSISFKNAEFNKWRKQFDRVGIRDASGTLISAKGHIVATRFATEADGKKVKSKLYAEDPDSPGETSLREAPQLANSVIALHYAELAAKIRQPILSNSLALNLQVPPEIQFPAFVWEFLSPPLSGKRFVGGFYPGREGIAPLEINLNNERTVFLNQNPLRLDLTPATFFGVEEAIFSGLCSIARGGDELAKDLPPFPEIAFFDSAVSVLRDGSIVAPVNYLSPIGLRIY
ncbi:hypothetical protein [Roseibium aggregatum]|uniref:Uncharacterized protein n=1 Tax=Roseibium aggregatum TaxID=187304 RepID=A0A939J2R0_9HYPH|nr:hypothetical protein [Roseibium aggregatum]MBN9673451.1 hypothetical protein [Roseibium aggregatum]